MDVTKPYEFIGFGAMDVTKPYESMGFGAMDVTKPYEFILFLGGFIVHTGGWGGVIWGSGYARRVNPGVPRRLRRQGQKTTRFLKMGPRSG